MPQQQQQQQQSGVNYRAATKVAANKLVLYKGSYQPNDTFLNNLFRNFMSVVLPTLDAVTGRIQEL